MNPKLSIVFPSSFLSFFSLHYLDSDIDTFKKAGGQFEVHRISIQFVLEGNCLLPCFRSLARQSNLLTAGLNIHTGNPKQNYLASGSRWWLSTSLKEVIFQPVIHG
jgi:hypothetical protein